MADQNDQTAICNATEEIAKQFKLIIESIHAPGDFRVASESPKLLIIEEDQRIISISESMTDLLLLNGEGNIDLSRLDYRRTQLSQIAQLASMIPSNQESELDALRQEISKVIARLLVSIYCDC